ncbi:MAG: cytochrome c biogenesis protein CcsA [Gammaproteobacteria bacterium]|jgi:ABC-type uncharacterized transport system permease subunit
MNTVLFGLIAIALYVTVAVRASANPAAAHGGYMLRSSTGLLAVLALAAHAVTLYPMTVTGGGLNLGIFAAASLVAWLIAGVAVLATTRRPLGSLAVVILPFAAVIVALSLIFSHPHLVVVAAAPGIALHIALSLVAYALFAIAALQALYYAFAERRLKQHHPVMSFLPPLTVMERTMFQLTGLAFVLLSIGLALGALYIEDVRAQHLSHKIVFSLLAWATFAVLLAGRHWRRWRGRLAVRYVIGGFALLALGFFGSKIALELILQRA